MGRDELRQRGHNKPSLGVWGDLWYFHPATRGSCGFLWHWSRLEPIHTSQMTHWCWCWHFSLEPLLPHSSSSSHDPQKQLQVRTNCSVIGHIALRPLLSNVRPHAFCPWMFLRFSNMHASTGQHSVIHKHHIHTDIHVHICIHGAWCMKADLSCMTS